METCGFMFVQVWIAIEFTEFWGLFTYVLEDDLFYESFLLLNVTETRLGCFDVTAILGWGWWSWGLLKLRSIEVEVVWSWGWS